MINFKVGDIVTVRQDYVREVLANAETFYLKGERLHNLKNTLTILSYLDHTPAAVIDTGVVDTLFDDNVTHINRSYIKVVPLNVQNVVYNAGSGVAVYWEEDETINQMFQACNVYNEDTRWNQVLNKTEKKLPQGQLVKLASYDKNQKMLCVDPTDANICKNSVVWGILTQEIDCFKSGIVRWYRPGPFKP